MTEARQIIVIRHDLHMRAGKIAAQAAHASIAFLTNALRSCYQITPSMREGYDRYEGVILSKEQQAWIEGAFVKVCVRVESEAELLAVHQKAIDAGLTSYLIQDAGRTEFNGVPTYTSCGIGPHWGEDFVGITDHLKLL